MPPRAPDFKPRVSVLLPARDAAATLPACLRSLARQSEPRWECVLVDDGSRDATGELARAAAARDGRVRVVSTPPRGLVPALRTAVREARAPLLARMDADDWAHRQRLARQLRALERAPELAGVGCHVRLFPRPPTDGRREYERWLNGLCTPDDVRRDRFVECPLAHPTWMLRRQVLDRFPYRACGWPEDYDLLLRALGAGLRLGSVPERLVAWRDRPDRLSRSHPAYAQERFTACKAAHLVEQFLAADETYVLWGYGGTGRALRRALARHGRHPSHVVELHPGRLGQRIHGAPVVPPAALPSLPRRPLVASVAGSRARGLIREALAGMGLVEERDFVVAA